MELEVRGVPPQARGKLQTRLRNYKNDLKQLQNDFKRAQVAIGQQDRENLFSGHEDLQVTSLDQRARLLQNTNTLDRSTDRIRDSYRTVTETEEIGNGILNDLGRQRETITRVRDHVADVDANTTRGSRILRAMGRRVMTNKLILAFIILVLMGIIGLIIYLKWFNDQQTSGGSSSTK
eukprot:TRINITY_DN1922_c0_g3_i1.p1 TRINITY_DN1922_c0_g3~~TRINITY_DN1922_c0_g3_i1.p1  ORF type:complete len:178 (+),score=47.73 TRINITY_DN1922_c0_g3_i1:188-721(+)